jgi:hypothetical protein
MTPKKVETEIQREIPVNDNFDGEQPSEEIMSQIRNRPYKYIRDYYESIYPFIGSQIFSILSLVPVSLIMPKFNREGKGIKQKISLFLMSGPGTGKSSIARELEKISYFPVSTLNITPARLFHEIKIREKVTLIIPDASITLSREELIKALENILGEEESISRNTMKNKNNEEGTEMHRDGVGFISGTPDLIVNQRIRDGLLSRCSPLVIDHTQEQHEHMIDLVNGKIGKENKNISNNPIPFFYKELYEIQEGLHNSIKPIEGYIIDEHIKESIASFIKPLVKVGFNMMGVHAIRQLEQAYRYMCSHAFLNILSGKRKIINNKLEINSEDLEVAKHLIKREIETQTIILMSVNAINWYNLRTINELRDWAKTHKTPPTAYSIMKGIVKNN